MMGNMGSVVGSDAGPGGANGPGARGVVSRPRLFGRLAGQARVSVVSASAGSGKTVLLRSWISQAGLADCAAWVAAGRGERDPQRFWLSVLGALRQTAPGSLLVQPLTAAPDLDGWAITERLLTDLLAGRGPAPPAGPRLPVEPLSESELRVLRYLPTNLSGPEIAGELYVSLNTVRTHLRHLYGKLGTHRRAEAVARARALGLLAPSPHRGQTMRVG
jgi:ATP/maltotriose-dependent transcriptional regulator MalT